MRASITVFLCGMAACSPVTTERCPTMGEAPPAPSSVDAATTEPETIGTNVSSGCIRMVNQDIVHLYTRASVKTRVIVLA